MSELCSTSSSCDALVLNVQRAFQLLFTLVHTLDHGGFGMEDEFFASVLRKWAESSQQVVDLKKRLSEVEQEVSRHTQGSVCSVYHLPQRNNYQHQMSRLKSQSKGLVKRHSPISIRCDNGGNLDLDETRNRLEEARVNYQRQLREVSTSPTILQVMLNTRCPAG